jgi:hypothetical protein
MIIIVRFFEGVVDQILVQNIDRFIQFSESRQIEDFL